jgi:hypothetical protein
MSLTTSFPVGVPKLIAAAVLWREKFFLQIRSSDPTTTGEFITALGYKF